MIRPKEYLAADHALPMEVPRVRYEVVTRRVRTGNDPPVANAGPNQIGVAAGTVQLDGSASYDPDGDPITFQWTQQAATGRVTLAKPRHLAADLYGRRRADLQFPPGGQGRPWRARASPRPDFHQRGEPGADSVLHCDPGTDHRRAGGDPHLEDVQCRYGQYRRHRERRGEQHRSRSRPRRRQPIP